MSQQEYHDHALSLWVWGLVSSSAQLLVGRLFGVGSASTRRPALRPAPSTRVTERSKVTQRPEIRSRKAGGRS
jgi:hypothetical protein